MAYGPGDADSQSVVVGRPRANVPEFPHVLRRKAKRAILPVQRFQRAPCNLTLRAILVNCADQKR